MGDHKGQIFSQELQLITWPVIINDFGICYMFNVCELSRYLSPVVEIWFILCWDVSYLRKAVNKKNVCVRARVCLCVLVFAFVCVCVCVCVCARA